MNSFSVEEKIFPSAGAPVLKRGVDLRYLGQEHTVTVDIDDLGAWTDLRNAFDAAHARAYGYAATDASVELLNIRLTAIDPLERPRLRKLEPSAAQCLPSSRRPVYSLRASRSVETAVFHRSLLAAGDRIEGPALIEEESTTTVIDIGDRLHVNETGFMVIEVCE